MLQKLYTLSQQGLINDLDYQFTRWLSDKAQHSSPEFQLGACLASAWTSNGNVCINLPFMAGRSLFSEQASELHTPAYSVWRDALRQSGVVGWPGEMQPLILDERGRLYLYRYWLYEQGLKSALLTRAEALEPPADLDRLKVDLDRYFGVAAESCNWQKIAGVTAALRRLCIISGGPGTGKTTTVVKILAILQAQNKGKPLRIRLAAPTGKAAVRLQEAIRDAKQRMSHEPWLQQAIPEEAETLHRLLGTVPDSVYFRHNEQNPLALDVLVIDEASMVDLALMAKLMDALPTRARLIMLGDKDQLASVEAGAVLGDICGDHPGFSASFRRRLEAISDENLPHSSASNRSPMRDCVVLLKHSYRFGADSGIGELSRAVNRGAASVARRLLGNQQFPDLAWWTINKQFSTRLAQAMSEGYADYISGLKAEAEPSVLFEAFNRFRVLSALRHGHYGVEALNALIERLMHEQGLLRVRQPWYHGRPIMITRNDYDLRLYNGDIGLALNDQKGRIRVYFQTADGLLRCLPTSRLPSHETVFAMTVHKSQGSEFDQILLLLPPESNAVLSRELLYTGITRARKLVSLWGNDKVFRAVIERRSQRSSGLAEALWQDKTDS